MNRHTVEDTRNLAQLPEIGQEIYREYRAEGLTPAEALHDTRHDLAAITPELQVPTWAGVRQ